MASLNFLFCLFHNNSYSAPSESGRLAVGDAPVFVSAAEVEVACSGILLQFISMTCLSMHPLVAL
jgi:hypothetical protein